MAGEMFQATIWCRIPYGTWTNISRPLLPGKIASALIGQSDWNRIADMSHSRWEPSIIGKISINACLIIAARTI